MTVIFGIFIDSKTMLFSSRDYKDCQKNMSFILLSNFKVRPVFKITVTFFLWPGKTTLLQHILKNKEDLKCAVIVNDMAVC